MEGRWATSRAPPNAPMGHRQSAGTLHEVLIVDDNLGLAEGGDESIGRMLSLDLARLEKLPVVSS
jgi:hypothetical protein